MLIKFLSFSLIEKICSYFVSSSYTIWDHFFSYPDPLANYFFPYFIPFYIESLKLGILDIFKSLDPTCLRTQVSPIIFSNDIIVQSKL